MLNGQAEIAEQAREGAQEARYAIENMTVSAQTLPHGSEATAVKTATDGSFNIHLGIPAGRGFTILGRYDSREALEGSIQEASVGDAYQVGTEAPYDVYIYDAVDGWVNSGPINADLPPHLIVGEDSEVEGRVAIDADTLEGHDAAYFASKTEMNAELEKKQNVLPYYTNKNLLDNPDFRNPVNQRGQTGYINSSLAWIYTVDRWKIQKFGTYYDGPATLTITPNEYTSVQGTIRQDFEGMPLLRSSGNRIAMTLSILTDDDLLSRSWMVPYGNFISDDLGFGGIQVGYLPSDPERGFVVINVLTKILKIVAIKLELGDTQTLAHKEGDRWVLNEIPDYAEELAKCQRYYYPAPPTSYITGGSYSASSVFLFVPTPVTMRAAPAISVEQIGALYVNGQRVQPLTNENIRVYNVASNGILLNYFNITASAADQNAIVINARYSFSADI